MKLRVALVAFGIIFLVWYNFTFADPRNDDPNTLAIYWIQSGLFFGVFVCGSVVTASFSYMIIKFLFSGEVSTSLQGKQRLKRGLGLCTGMIIVVSVTFILFFNKRPLTLSQLTLMSIVVTAVVMLMDWLLDLPDIAKQLDFPVLLTLIIVVGLLKLYEYFRTPADLWVPGFCGGAVAFQLIFATLLLDPNRYHWKSLFPHKEDI